jgi:phage terminase small subunit
MALKSKTGTSKAARPPEPARRTADADRRVKADTSKSAVAARQRAFALAYIANGRNGTQAAIKAGFSPKGADVAAVRLLGNARVSAMIEELTAKHTAAAGLTVDRALQATAWVSGLDPARLYREDGSTLKNIPDMDDETRAAIASFEIDEIVVGGVVVGHTKKVKFWDKNRALDMSFKHLGLYERDNAQRTDSLVLKVVLK